MEFGHIEAVYCGGLWLASGLVFCLLLACLKVSKRNDE
jgi:hypothetical protein